MRDVVLQQYAVSLDGFSCADGSEFQKYVFGVDDPEVDREFIETLSRAGTHIMGRATYLDMAGHWPSRSGPTADLMNSIPKVVFSHTLELADWPESRIARGDTAEEIARLKEEPGGEIVAHGGFSFTQSLVKLGLVDELRLYIFPVALGHGSSLFHTVDKLSEYEPTLIKRFPSGVVLQTLRSVRSNGTAARILKGESGQTEFLSQDPPINN
jgi:dihydrofolate reductase